MGIHSEPAAADLPLDGGRAGATVRLTGLLTATMTGPRAWFYREPGPLAGLRALGAGGGSGPRHRFPVGAFLVEHPSAGAFLVDAGLRAEAATAPRRELGRLASVAFGDVRVVPGSTAAARTRARGVEVRAILMTHLHWDHADGLADFPDTPVLVTRDEWHAARAVLSGVDGYVRRHLAAPVRWRLVDCDRQAATWGPFDRAVDVLGDGSVVMVGTPGHSPGHASVVVRLRDRLALLTGDAVYTMRALRERLHPWRLGQARAYHRSFETIRAFADAHPDALVVPGHDLDAWEASGIGETV
jgi:glyoxylase-like metal-dependent hydrolase (beta-lactamase superfamily II)